MFREHIQYKLTAARMPVHDFHRLARVMFRVLFQRLERDYTNYFVWKESRFEPILSKDGLYVECKYSNILLSTE